MGKSTKVKSVKNATPTEEASVDVTSFDGQTFTIYHPSRRPSFRAMMALWLASNKRLEVRQAVQADKLDKLTCWQLTDTLREAASKSESAFDKAIRLILKSHPAITKAASQPATKVKAGKDGKRPDVAAILKEAGLSGKAAKAIAALIDS